MRVLTTLGCLVAFASSAAVGQTQPAAIHACIGSSGLLQVVAAGTACNKNQTALTWNVAGPQGLVGPPGPPGPSTAFTTDNFSGGFGAEVLSSDPSNPTEIAALDLPAGNYVLNAVIGLYASVPLGTLAPFSPVQCSLRDGTAIVGTEFRALVGGATASFASLPVVATITLPAAGTVTVACVAGAGLQVLTRPSTLTAIQVSTLSTQ